MKADNDRDQETWQRIAMAAYDGID